MPRYRVIPKKGETKKGGPPAKPIMRRGKPMGTLRSPAFGELRRTAEARRTAKKAAKLQKRVRRRMKFEDRTWLKRLERLAIDTARRLKAIATKLNPPGRRGPPKPGKKPPLINRLVIKQEIGTQWIGIIQRMEREGMLKVTPETNLRQELARIMRPFNRGAARHFAAGGHLYLSVRQRNQPISTILRNARTKVAMSDTAAKSQEARKKREKIKAAEEKARIEEHEEFAKRIRERAKQ